MMRWVVMKRLLSMLCAAALLILMLSPGAQAVSITNAESWDLYCLYTVPGSAVVYDLTIQEIATATSRSPVPT